MTRIRQFLSNYRVALLVWVLIIIVIYAGLYYSVDRSVVALSVLVLGVLGQAFGALIAWIGLLPLVGPMVAQVLSLPFIWCRICGLDHCNKAGIFQRCIELSNHHHRAAFRYHVRVHSRETGLMTIDSRGIL